MNPYELMLGLREGGAVKRYHTTRTLRQQTVADHSWGVCLLLLVAGLATPGSMALAVLHDVPECRTGDVPAPAKWGSMALTDALETLEMAFHAEHRVDTPTASPLDVAALNWADTYELCQWCLEEIQMGNRYASAVFMRGSNQLGKRWEKLRRAGASDAVLNTVQVMNNRMLENL